MMHTIEVEVKKPKRAISKVSCGFILQHKQKLLFCKPTGSKLLDFPKGMRKIGETSIAAALRELREETGIILGTTALKLVDLGKESYSKQKNLHLYYVKVDELDITQLWCESRFATRWGSIEPEITGYELLTITEAWPKLAAGMKAYLKLKQPMLNIRDWI